MSSPFFSIIIPTRNRQETLPYALLTCLNQVDFEDYEIIISDNSDNRIISYKAIEFCLNEKIRYIYPPHIMSMTDHWEFALNFARGEYVTYLGDDDGLLRQCLITVAMWLHAHDNIEAVISKSLLYLWPNAMNFEIN